MQNVYEQIDTNKRRSLLVIAGFVAFVISFVWLLGQIFNTDPGFIIIAVIFSLVSAFSSYFWGDKLILNLSGAKPADRDQHFNFYTAAENLAIAAQIPKPELYVIDSPALNAFATGRDPDHAVICATTGLINKLDKSELEAVIAHEISHITNYDIRLMTIVAVLVGTISLLSNWILRSRRLGISGKDENKKSSPLTLALGIIGLILAPIAAKLIQLALSRQREYFADTSAVKLTRQPQSLISALQKLDQNPTPLQTANTATAHLYVVNPLKNINGGIKKLATLFSTHPPIEERINNLKQML
jgi:heat shock protein HtpX